MITLALAALALAVVAPDAPPAAAGAPPPQIAIPVAATPPPPEVATPAVVAAPPAGPLEGPRHLVALGWDGITFTSRESSKYGFQSAAIGYHGSWGPRGPLLEVTALLPLQARQDGAVYTTRDYYDRRVGGDLLAGWQRRWALGPAAEAEGGAGVHATILWLPGKSGYRDFSAMPVGLGGTGTLRWRPGGTAFGRRVVLGTYLSAAVDFYDPLRSNDLRYGFTLRLGLTAGVEGRP